MELNRNRIGDLLCVAIFVGVVIVPAWQAAVRAQPYPNPLIVESDHEPGGEFTVSLTFQRTAQPVCFQVPAGHYSQVWTLIAPFDDTTARGWLNIYRWNPNAAAPTTKGLQISQRFDLFKADTSGDLWRVSDTSFDGPTTLCATVGGAPDSVGMVWLGKLVGKL